LNKQVGGELGIRELTVKAHRGQIMQKMKANSLADLVRMAAKLGSALQEVHFARRQPVILFRQCSSSQARPSLKSTTLRRGQTADVL
jgi:hypothetical protein